MPEIIEYISGIMKRGPLARKLIVKGGMVGSWAIDQVFDALATMASKGMLWYDGEDADERGEGTIKLIAPE